MNRSYGLLSILAAVVLLGTIGSCSPGDRSGRSSATTSPSTLSTSSRGITGNIKTGAAVASASVLVETSGGTITVSEPGTPITGLALTVPPDSYASAKQFKISYAPVESHSFGTDFNPITPMISIDNGGGYAGDIMQIKIPVNIPADSFAMGFIYDKTTKTLEGMPLLDESATSITVGTGHFTDFVISMIQKVKLKKDIDSHFRPGIDDWQFTNNGSYIAPGGHCAGQSMTVLWYYCTQPDGKDQTLYGRYDNNSQKPATPALEVDDSLGIRFVSAVMNDIDQNLFTYQFQKNLRGTDDELQWNAFAYAIQLTEEPQYIGLTSNAGGGHAMVVYRVKDGNLYIADPNYPGNTERRIEYLQGKFTPYESGATKKDIDEGRSTRYENLGYMAKTSLVNWGQIAKRWTELKNKTIGNDLFPQYKIVYRDDRGQYQELKDGMSWASDKITLGIDYSGTLSGVIVYRDGVVLKPDANVAFELKLGNNLLGIYVTKAQGTTFEYVDFKYINVIYGGLTLKPASQNAEPNQNMTFDLELTQPAPAGSKFEWYVDSTLKKTGYDFSITVSFPSEGTHTIAARVVDSSGKVVLQAMGTAIVKAKPVTSFVPGNNLIALQKMTTINIGMKGKWSTKRWSSTGERNEDSYIYINIPSSSAGTLPLQITWNGASFSGKRTSGIATYGTTEEIKGTVSADGQTLTSLTWTLVSTAEGKGDAYVGAWNSEDTWTLTLQNIPISQLVFEKATSTSFSFTKSGPDLKAVVADVAYHNIVYRVGNKESENTAVFSSIKWDDTSFQGTPTLNLSIK